MTPQQLRELIGYLEERVRLAAESSRHIVFDPPAETEMIGAGLDPDGVRRLLAVAWWQEMVDEVIETPEFCDPDEPPEQLLRYARDVVGEYIRKRFPLE